jgi:hypothetical protein
LIIGLAFTFVSFVTLTVHGGQQCDVHDDGLWRHSFCLRKPLDVERQHRKGDPEADHDDEQTREKDKQAPANQVVLFWPAAAGHHVRAVVG